MNKVKKINILKLFAIFVSLILLNVCMSVSAKSKYQRPSLPLASATIEGMRKDNKGFLSVDETLSIVTIDGQYVAGNRGAKYSDKIPIYSGLHTVEVLYRHPGFLVGSAAVKFYAADFTEYQFKFDLPHHPKQAELDDYNRTHGTNFDYDTLWGVVWVEKLGTGAILSRAIMPLIP